MTLPISGAHLGTGPNVNLQDIPPYPAGAKPGEYEFKDGKWVATNKGQEFDASKHQIPQDGWVKRTEEEQTTVLEENKKIDDTKNQTGKLSEQLEDAVKFGNFDEKTTLVTEELIAEVKKQINNSHVSFLQLTYLKNDVKSLFEVVNTEDTHNDKVSDEIKTEAETKNTTVTKITQDFGYFLTSAYKAFNGVETEEEVEETDMDLVE